MFHLDVIHILLCIPVKLNTKKALFIVTDQKLNLFFINRNNVRDKYIEIYLIIKKLG